MKNYPIAFRKYRCVFIIIMNIIPTVFAGSLNYRTSWLGNSFNGDFDGWKFSFHHVQHYMHAMHVASDGTCYVNSIWDEGAKALGIYKDGETFGHGAMNGGGWAVTADSDNIYAAEGQSGVTRFDLFADPDTALISRDWGSTTIANSEIRGLATQGSELYMSDFTNNKIVVYSKATLTELRTWVMSRPGAIVVDNIGNLWIIQLKDTATPGRALCFQPNGTPLTNRTISDLVDPTALAYDANRNLLLVAENGPDQQVRFYTNLSGAPALHSTFGDRGGIYSGVRGEVGEIAGRPKFNGIRGIGIDGQGNIYVACTGAYSLSSGNGGGELRKYSPAGNLIGGPLLGLETIDCASADPASETDVFTQEEHFTMDYSKSNGQEATYKGYTLDPFIYPDDPRLHQSMVGPRVTRIDGQRFLVISSWGGNLFAFYRFAPATHGEIAIPCMLISHSHIEGSWPPYQPPPTPGDEAGVNSGWVWTDNNGDGQFAANEYESLSYLDMWEGSNAREIESRGHIWEVRSAGPPRLRFWRYQGLNPSGCPIYALPTEEPAPEPFHFTIDNNITLNRALYDAERDFMILTGNTPGHTSGFFRTAGSVIVRYDRWSAGNRIAKYQTFLPLTSNIGYQSQNEPQAIYPAGDYLFIGNLYGGDVTVYNIHTGILVGTITAGMEVGGITGWIDAPFALTAYKRSNGEYLIFVEEEVGGKIMMYRWTPSVPQDGLKMWLKADKGVALASGLVRSWADQSGNRNNATQTASANMPRRYSKIINGLPIIRFDGINDFMTAGSLNGSMDEFTTFWMLKPSDTIDYNQQLGATGGWGQFHFETTATGSANVGTDFASRMMPGVGAGQIPDGTIVPDSWQRLAFSIKNRLGTFYKNGDLIASKTLDTPAPWTGFQLGTSADTTLRGDLAEILVYNRALSSDEMTAVNRYLNDRYSALPKVDQGLLGWWKQDDSTGTTTTDSSGNGYHGTLQGGATWSIGRRGGAITFNGSTSYASLPQALLSYRTVESVSLWFKTTGSGGLLSQQITNPGTPGITDGGPLLYVGNDGHLWGGFFTDSRKPPLRSAAVVNNGAWHHIALVGDGNTQKLYLDRILVGTINDTIWHFGNRPVLGTAYTVNIPSSPAGGWFPFSGQIDEVRLYNRTLTAAEIATLSRQ